MLGKCRLVQALLHQLGAIERLPSGVMFCICGFDPIVVEMLATKQAIMHGFTGLRRRRHYIVVQTIPRSRMLSHHPPTCQCTISLRVRILIEHTLLSLLWHRLGEPRSDLVLSDRDDLQNDGHDARHLLAQPYGIHKLC